jgi:hypothetical protein
MSTSIEHRPVEPVLRKGATPSRRALLAGALGGLGALAAKALGGPSVARAENEAIVVGGEYLTAESRTFVKNQTNGANVLVAQSTSSGYGVYGLSNSNTGVYGSSGSSYGVRGFSGSHIGVYGSSSSGTGVYGFSSAYNGVSGSSYSSTGVYGSSQLSIGVYGFSSATDQPAVRGHSSLGNSTGVQGTSGIPPLTAMGKTGVHGYATQDSSARGVVGETTIGHGIHGIATSGFAGYFAGKVYTTKWYEFTEISAPAAPAANKARLFVRDVGDKSQLCVRFSSGAIQVLASQP